MTATTNDTKQRFTAAAAAAINDARATGNLRALHGAAACGFKTAGALLAEVGKMAEQKHDREIQRRLAEAAADNIEARSEFERLANRHFVGSATGRERYLADQQFKNELAARFEQRMMKHPPPAAAFPPTANAHHIFQSSSAKASSTRPSRRAD